jgi:hypothetical protein
MLDALRGIVDLFHLRDRPSESEDTPILLPRTRDDLARVLAALGCACGAEVGVLRGDYAATLLTANPDLRLYAVDSWQSYDGYPDFTDQSVLDLAQREARARLAAFGERVTILHTASALAAREVGPRTLDFVYIDGNHLFDYVMEDLIVWGRCVKPGGLIAGHDYVKKRAGRRYGPFQVVEAVTAYRHYMHCTNPLCVLTEPDRPEPPSFFFVK